MLRQQKKYLKHLRRYSVYEYNIKKFIHNYINFYFLFFLFFIFYFLFFIYFFIYFYFIYLFFSKFMQALSKSSLYKQDYIWPDE